MPSLREIVEGDAHCALDASVLGSSIFKASKVVVNTLLVGLIELTGLIRSGHWHDFFRDFTWENVS